MELIYYLMGRRYYSQRQVDELLTEQREICGKRMDEWCKYNNFKECGHVVQYAPRPEYDN